MSKRPVLGSGSNLQLNRPVTESSSKDPSSSSLSTSQPLELTIGCEFEFILAHYKGKDRATPVNTSSSAHGKRIVHQALSESITVVCDKCGRWSPFPLFLKPLDYVPECYEMWQVDSDPSVYLTPEERVFFEKHIRDYDFHSVEIKSRILRQNSGERKTCCDHPLTFAEEIKAVLAKLDIDFGEFSPTGRTKFHILLNSNCGFHVHIGNELNPFPLPIVKKVLSLFLACERQIDGLHAYNRIDGWDFGEDPYGLPEFPFGNAAAIAGDTCNYPLSMFYMAGTNVRRRRDHKVLVEQQPLTCKEEMAAYSYPDSHVADQRVWNASRQGWDVDSWLTLVRHAPDVISLQELYNHNGKNCTINIDNLEAEDGSPCTIEFRQQAATLQPEAVLSWIDVVTSIVEKCHTTQEAEFYKLIDSGGRFRHPTKFTTISLLCALGCTQETLTSYSNQLNPDLLTKTTPWLDERENSAHDHKDADPIALLAHTLIRAERENHRAYRVQERILSKLVRGGYGQFREDSLDRMFTKTCITAHERARLRIGYLSDLVPAEIETTGTEGRRANKLPGYRDKEVDASSSEKAKSGSDGDVEMEWD